MFSFYSNFFCCFMRLPCLILYLQSVLSCSPNEKQTNPRFPLLLVMRWRSTPSWEWESPAYSAMLVPLTPLLPWLSFEKRKTHSARKCDATIYSLICTSLHYCYSVCYLLYKMFDSVCYVGLLLWLLVAFEHLRKWNSYRQLILVNVNVYFSLGEQLL